MNMRKGGAGLNQLHLIDILFLFTIVAGKDAVSNVEMGGHRLVVGDALGVIALHNALDDCGGLYGFLRDDFIVPDDG